MLPAIKRILTYEVALFGKRRPILVNCFRFQKFSSIQLEISARRSLRYFVVRQDFFNKRWKYQICKIARQSDLALTIIFLLRAYL